MEGDLVSNKEGNGRAKAFSSGKKRIEGIFKVGREIIKKKMG